MITIPYRVRKELDIKVGTKLLVQVEGNKIVLIKKTGNITSLGLKTGRKITEEEINETKREAEREIGSGYFHPLIPKS